MQLANVIDLNRYPGFRTVLENHPGLIPVSKADPAAVTDLSRAVQYNQATRVTTRDSRLMDSYDPGVKASETFASPDTIDPTMVRWDLEQKYPGTGIRVQATNRESFIHVRDRDLTESRYLRRHPEVADSIYQRTALQQEYVNPELADTKDVTFELARSAANQLDSLHPSEDTLNRQPELAAWINENRADIRAAMETHGETITGRSETDTWNLLRERIADAAMTDIPIESPLTHDFFVNNPAAALYLKENPRVREDLLRHNDRAQEFISGFSSISQRLQPELIERAANRAASPGQYNERYFSNHSELAVISESARALLPNLNLADQYTGVEYNPESSDRTLAENAERAWSRTTLQQGNITSAYAENTPWLPRLINRDSGFRERVASAAGKPLDRLPADESLLRWSDRIEVENSTLNHVNLAV